MFIWLFVVRFLFTNKIVFGVLCFSHRRTHNKMAKMERLYGLYGLYALHIEMCAYYFRNLASFFLKISKSERDVIDTDAL